MSDQRPDSREMGRLMALGQVGFEMVVPIGLGVYLDNQFGWAPWGVVTGTVLGLVGGLAHLVLMLKRFENQDPSQQDRS